MGSINQPIDIKPSESRLFKPLKVGNNTLQHRNVFAPLTRHRNDDDHVPLPFMEKYYADRACEPGTLVISEATGISHAEEGVANLPGFVSDKQVEGWSKIIKAVHDKGSIYFQQIWGMGRASDPAHVISRGYRYRSSSTVPMEGVDVTPEAMTEDDIQETIRNFVATAKRVIAAGADGVEVHSAHGYLLDQFLSDSINKRTDKWGGSVENRARLTVEVVRAVSDAIGGEKVGVRVSPFAGFQGSAKSDIKELYTYLIQELKSRQPSLAYLSLVEPRGDPGVLLLGHEGINLDKSLDFILKIWDNHSPVLVAGGYTPKSAVQAVEEHYKQWDVMIGFGRYFLSTPDLVFRIRKELDLNPYDRSTFYLNKMEEGYNDYPFSKEFLKQQSAHM